MRPTQKISPRALAARVIEQVLVQGRFLDAALTETVTPSTSTAALIQEMSYGTLRWYHQLAGIATLLLDKPLKPKDQDVHALLLLGLYQLRHMRVAPHAAVTETVDAAQALKKPWAKGLLNACLREYQRQEPRVQQQIADDPTLAYSHPAWLLEIIRNTYPENWQAILAANNERPPMVLRVNAHKLTRAQYLERLQAAGFAAHAAALTETGIVLETPAPVTELPGFATGEVSVQDGAAQLAAILLDAQAGERVLDACAAPGGKTGHILERTPSLLELVALDRDSDRMARIAQNLTRLGLPARLITGDATAPEKWWDSQPFDRILLDAPCSATGVIRRHPDIKVRRQFEELPKLIETQRRILDSLWPLLKPGGKLLYVTCSILPTENQEQMQAFLARHPDATETALPFTVGARQTVGYQVVPGELGMDGFFYASLRKS